MTAYHFPRKSFGLWFLLAAALFGIASLAILEPFQQTARRGSSDTPTATYAHGALETVIPYRAPRAGAGQLAVEVLDPDDKALGRIGQHVTVNSGKGTWQESVKLAKPLGVDELVWQRLRYRFTYDGDNAPAIDDTESVSTILRMPVVRILGQQSYLSGGQAAVRVIVTDSKNDFIPGRGAVRIELAGPNPHVLFTGRLDARGTTEAQFQMPSGLVGTFPLRYVADTPIGTAEFTQQVRLEDKVSVLLTTEKPIYQPGQSIHARALALDRANHTAAAARKLTFEAEDSRGNKVFKKVTQTDKFGIASAEFDLADEVNLGTYHLRARLGDDDSANTAELTLNVERYVLPKFKVAIDFAGEGKPAKLFYKPGDHVTGTVRANYFFGKPVDRAEVSIKASGMDVAQFEAVSVQGKTDDEGAWRFDLKLPAYFAGRPLSHGTAPVLIEATVKDSAGHSETRGAPVTVSASPLIVTAVPEGGTLVPALDNQVFILTAYPDGKPAPANVRVRAAGNPEQSAVTDDGGVAVVRIKPGTETETLDIVADDKDGNHAATSAQLDVRPGAAQILLRTAHAVYRAGDRIALQVFSTQRKGTAYVDVVREGQTVLTRDVDIVNGRAELNLAATPDLAGTVDISAYLFGADAQPVADHRLIFVQPADELKIDAVAAPAYKPGEEARVSFRVTNSRGEGVQAALGLQVVDEAVFALAERQPGFAKVFFYLEQEAMKPRYEIHSFGMPDVVTEVPRPLAEQHDRAAR
ncbi:MAG TPA: MG2 domain-containing protein, partial [Bryobacteraceae bacterium]|nr:MG2 domain-containing protein [Bryobacteraceae bacterium]